MFYCKFYPLKSVMHFYFSVIHSCPIFYNLSSKFMQMAKDTKLLRIFKVCLYSGESANNSVRRSLPAQLILWWRGSISGACALREEGKSEEALAVCNLHGSGKLVKMKRSQATSASFPGARSLNRDTSLHPLSSDPFFCSSVIIHASKKWRRIQYEERDDPRCFINFHAGPRIMSPGKRLHICGFLIFCFFVAGWRLFPGGCKIIPRGAAPTHMRRGGNKNVVNGEKVPFFRSALGNEWKSEMK